ncbi:hypothetical protein [Microcoleus vaginatus]|uniref:hypothetical protein n=1 Tax=Microcoleus vaginatus TaxID=119532 RepID=UPI001F61D6A0
MPVSPAISMDRAIVSSRFRLHQYCSNVKTVMCPESIILVNSQQSTVNNHLARATGIDMNS